MLWLAIFAFTSNKIRLDSRFFSGIDSLFKNIPTLSGDTKEKTDYTAHAPVKGPAELCNTATPVLSPDLKDDKSHTDILFIPRGLSSELFTKRDKGGKPLVVEGHPEQSWKTHPYVYHHGLLAHKQRVKNSGMALAAAKTEEDSGTYSVIFSHHTGPHSISNPTVMYVHVVSLEGVYAMKNWPLTDAMQFVAMLCVLAESSICHIGSANGTQGNINHDRAAKEVASVPNKDNPDLLVTVDNLRLKTPSLLPLLLRHEIVTEGTIMSLFLEMPSRATFTSLKFAQPTHQQNYIAATKVRSNLIDVIYRKAYTIENVDTVDHKLQELLPNVKWDTEGKAYIGGKKEDGHGVMYLWNNSEDEGYALPDGPTSWLLLVGCLKVPSPPACPKPLLQSPPERLPAPEERWENRNLLPLTHPSTSAERNSAPRYPESPRPVPVDTGLPQDIFIGIVLKKGCSYKLEWIRIEMPLGKPKPGKPTLAENYFSSGVTMLSNLREDSLKITLMPQSVDPEKRKIDMSRCKDMSSILAGVDGSGNSVAADKDGNVRHLEYKEIPFMKFIDEGIREHLN
ncbi:hypothetical protein GGR58DRAFT_507680 [Xylaria digitata]|nr:hypothetical protein GGR58DRAFT_507680 [Xylaria digitata]